MDNSGRKEAMARMSEAKASGADEPDADDMTSDTGPSDPKEALGQIIQVLTALAEALPPDQQGQVAKAIEMLSQVTETPEGGASPGPGSSGAVAENSMGTPFPGGQTA